MTISVARTLSVLTVPDHRLMRKLNHWDAPHWFRRWMILATRAGDGGLWAVCGAALLWMGAYTVFAAAGLAVAEGILLFTFLKKRVGRPRPCQLEAHCWATLLPPDQFSFPSGHSITAFAVAVPLGLVYPVLWAPLLFCAASVAISRVVLGLHFLTDVVAGCALGSGLGAGMLWVVMGLSR
jgi:undecaprenyl-diphosphatase